MWLITILSLWFCAFGYDGLPDDMYEWRVRGKYYYPSVEDKLTQIMPGKCVGIAEKGCVESKTAQSTPECKGTFKIVEADTSTDDFMLAKQTAELAATATADQGIVITYPPSKKMFNAWHDIPRPVQMRMDPQLCKEPWKFPNPVLKGNKCRNANYMHDGAPRCQAPYLRWICDKSSLPRTEKRGNGFALPESDHSKADHPPIPYMVVTKDALVSMCGQVVKDCGFILTNAGCMANDFNNRMLKQTLAGCNLGQARDGIAGGAVAYNSKFPCHGASGVPVNVTRVNRLFIAGEVDDTHIYHVLIEIMPRIIRHLEFLKANPDVRILYGCDRRPSEKMTRVGLIIGLTSLRPLLKIVGINPDRLVVHSDVYADVVYQPTEGGCQDAVFNTWVLLKTRDVLLVRAGQLLDKVPADYGSFWPSLHEHIEAKPVDQSYKPVMVIIRRSFKSKHTRNKRDNIRQWNDEFIDHLLMAMRSAFPSFKIVVFNDQDEELMTCMHCQIDFIAQAKVLIGVHGAGLMHQIFMQPSGAVVEIGNYANDGRLLMGGGPFSRLSTLLGHNYMVHYPPFGSETVMTFAERVSHFNITNFVGHVDSFLQSIHFI